MVKRENPKRGWLLTGRLETVIREAVREDGLGRGIPVSAAVASELAQFRGRGRSLPGWLARLFGSRLNCDFSAVRLHSGDDVDALASRFQAAAFCVGGDVFLHSCVVRDSPPPVALAVLGHELAHLAHGLEPRRIRCWERDGHERLTVMACQEFSAELDEVVKIQGLHLTKAELVEGLKIACSNMDNRQRVFHLFDTLRYALGSASPLYGWLHLPNPHLSELPLVGPLFAKGEGPRHGEGKNYTESQPEPNIELNKAAQTKEIEAAASWFQFDKAHDFDDWIPTIHIGFIAINEKEWIKSLGNALHIAQDRASHREGRKNFGHCDPRVVTGWEPDDPDNDDHTTHDREYGRSWWICNQAAFARGFNNSCEVLQQFLKRIKIQVFQKWTRKSVVCGNPDPTLLQRRRVPARRSGAAIQLGAESGCVYGQPPNFDHGCVHGRIPGPLVRRDRLQ